MRWLAKLFYYGRVRRLERLQEAAALLGAGRLEEAEERLRLARPNRWVDDLAVYHFVAGRLRMERGALDEAERHLHAALVLGLDRPSVKLNLAVIKVRQCALADALTLLSEVELSEDESVLEQARVMREVIAKVTTGDSLGEITDRCRRFGRKHLDRGLAEGPSDALERLAEVAKAVGSAKLSTKDREDAVLYLGHLAVVACGGSWLLGLEPRDHRILVAGIAWHPSAELEAFVSGESDALRLPTPDRTALTPGSGPSNAK